MSDEWARAEAEADAQGDDADEQRAKKRRVAARPLEGVCIVVSGIVNPERGELRDMALGLGAEYRGQWVSEATHLLAAFDGTDKTSAARRAGGAVVQPAWLRACADQGRRVGEADFELGARQKRRRPAPSAAAAAPAPAAKRKAPPKSSAAPASAPAPWPAKQTAQPKSGAGGVISLLDSSDDEPDAAAPAAAAAARPAPPDQAPADGGEDSDDTVDLEDADGAAAPAAAAAAAPPGRSTAPLRPACRHYDAASDDIVFMLLDSNHDEDASITRVFYHRPGTPPRAPAASFSSRPVRGHPSL